MIARHHAPPGILLGVLVVLVVLVALGAGGTALPASAAPARRPNVLLVLTDDQGYGDLGHHGNRVVRTPHLDRFAAESVRLTNFHSNPNCTPTRAALLTGRHPDRTGAWQVVGGRSIMDRGEMTMAEVFRASGYRTAIFGKWHLGDGYPYRPQDRGFDESVIHGGGGVGTTSDFWGNDYSDDTYLRNGAPTLYPGHSTDALFAEALAFIQKNREQPFFCYLATPAPHSPWSSLRSFSEPYHKQGLPHDAAEYYGMISHLDHNMGRLLARLEALGLAKDTVVIFMTDNGSSFGERLYNAGQRGGKGSPYEGGHRVPFFIRWPGGGLGGGRDIGALTAHFDVLPTLMALLDLRPPRRPRFDGIDLGPLLRGTAPAPADRLLVIDKQTGEHRRMWRHSAVMTPRWRLIEGRELYDVLADPGQKQDVAASHPEVMRDLRQRYEAWWADVARVEPVPAAYVVGAPGQGPAWLTTWDIRGQPVYMQYQVSESERADGYWDIEVARPGWYDIRLRRWPREVKRPLGEGLVVRRVIKKGYPEAEIRGVHAARLKVAAHDVTIPVEPDAQEAVFRLALRPGRTRLSGWFVNEYDQNGATFGAYYVEVAPATPKRAKAAGSPRH